MKRNHVYGLFIKLIILQFYYKTHTSRSSICARISAASIYNTDVSRADCYINCFNILCCNFIIYMCMCMRNQVFKVLFIVKPVCGGEEIFDIFFFFFLIKDLPYYRRATAIFSDRETNLADLAF